jgi:hypothetical protein
MRRPREKPRNILRTAIEWPQGASHGSKFTRQKHRVFYLGAAAPAVLSALSRLSDNAEFDANAGANL